MNGTGEAAVGRKDEQYLDDGVEVTFRVARRKGGNGRFAIVVEPPDDTDVIVSRKRKVRHDSSL